MVLAQQTLDHLVISRSEGSWNSLIQKYVKCGHLLCALSLYEKVKEDGSVQNIDGHTFVALLKACCGSKEMERAQIIHAEVLQKDLLNKDPFVGSALVTMYAECACLAKARVVFDGISLCDDTVLWNSLIAGYLKHGCAKEALLCFDKMQTEGGALPNAVTYICTLRACGNIRAIDKGAYIHCQILSKESLKRDIAVCNTLLDMYARCGFLVKAEEVFDKLLSVRDVVSWTALIGGYAKCERSREALDRFDAMQLAGMSPNPVTYACILRACGDSGDAERGQELHGDVANKGFERDLIVGNALVDMYTKCGLLVRAQEVFDQILVRGVVLWTTLITGYVRHKQYEKALSCLDLMQLDDVAPNAVTYVCGLQACGSIGAILKGQELYVEIARKGCIDSELAVGNALVDMYAKGGYLERAQEVFDILLVRDLVSWTTLIAGYTQHECGEKAINSFEHMQLEGFCPNAVTLVCGLKACSRMGAVERGQCLHMEVSSKGLDTTNVLVGSTLVDMYARCGLLTQAQQVFDKVPVRDETLWNTLIAGYVRLGMTKSVFCLFDRMRRDGKSPDAITFTSLLNTCSRAGLVGKGQRLFEVMTKEHGVAPTLSHHSCIVDLLGRAGEPLEAVTMVKRMPFPPNIVVWRAVLGACQKWGQAELGMHIIYALSLKQCPFGKLSQEV